MVPECGMVLDAYDGGGQVLCPVLESTSVSCCLVPCQLSAPELLVVAAHQMFDCQAPG